MNQLDAAIETVANGNAWPIVHFDRDADDRGYQKSVVRLSILPADAGPDGKSHVISLVRDNISLDKQAAKKRCCQ